MEADRGRDVLFACASDSSPLLSIHLPLGLNLSALKGEDSCYGVNCQSLYLSGSAVGVGVGVGVGKTALGKDASRGVEDRISLVFALGTEPLSSYITDCVLNLYRPLN